MRKKKYDLDSDRVKQYLELNRLTDAMHYVAGRLFNYDFKPVEEGKVPVFNKDVKVWEVNDKISGKHIGLWYLDPFARAGKRSGAWATTYRSYSSFDGEKNVLASNNSNFVKPAPGEPVLISWDDATTFFMNLVMLYIFLPQMFAILLLIVVSGITQNSNLSYWKGGYPAMK